MQVHTMWTSMADAFGGGPEALDENAKLYVSEFNGNEHELMQLPSWVYEQVRELTISPVATLMWFAVQLTIYD